VPGRSSPVELHGRRTLLLLFFIEPYSIFYFNKLIRLYKAALKIYLKRIRFYAVGKFKVKQVKTFIFASNEKRPLWCNAAATFADKSFNSRRAAG